MSNKLILTEQMRQQEDKRYAKLLNNLRECKILEDDFNLFKTRFLSNLNINLFEHPWNEAPFIVPRNDLKDAINDLMIEYYAKKNNKRCSIIVAEDTYNNNPLLGHI
jgi:hypothetical protein